MQKSTSTTMGTLRTPTRAICAQRFFHAEPATAFGDQPARNGHGRVAQQVSDAADEFKKCDRTGADRRDWLAKISHTSIQRMSVRRRFKREDTDSHLHEYVRRVCNTFWEIYTHFLPRGGFADSPILLRGRLTQAKKRSPFSGEPDIACRWIHSRRNS